MLPAPATSPLETIGYEKQMEFWSRYRPLSRPSDHLLLQTPTLSPAMRPILARPRSPSASSRLLLAPPSPLHASNASSLQSSSTPVSHRSPHLSPSHPSANSLHVSSSPTRSPHLFPSHPGSSGSLQAPSTPISHHSPHLSPSHPGSSSSFQASSNAISHRTPHLSSSHADNSNSVLEPFNTESDGGGGGGDDGGGRGGAATADAAGAARAAGDGNDLGASAGFEDREGPRLVSPSLTAHTLVPRAEGGRRVGMPHSSSSSATAAARPATSLDGLLAGEKAGAPMYLQGPPTLPLPPMYECDGEGDEGGDEDQHHHRGRGAGAGSGSGAGGSRGGGGGMGRHYSLDARRSPEKMVGHRKSYEVSPTRSPKLSATSSTMSTASTRLSISSTTAGTPKISTTSSTASHYSSSAAAGSLRLSTTSSTSSNHAHLRGISWGASSRAPSLSGSPDSPTAGRCESSPNNVDTCSSSPGSRRETPTRVKETTNVSPPRDITPNRHRDITPNRHAARCEPSSPETRFSVSGASLQRESSSPANTATEEASSWFTRAVTPGDRPTYTRTPPTAPLEERSDSFAGLGSGGDGGAGGGGGGDGNAGVGVGAGAGAGDGHTEATLFVQQSTHLPHPSPVSPTGRSPHSPSHSPHHLAPSASLSLHRGGSGATLRAAAGSGGAAGVGAGARGFALSPSCVSVQASPSAQATARTPSMSTSPTTSPTATASAPLRPTQASPPASPLPPTSLTPQPRLSDIDLGPPTPLVQPSSEKTLSQPPSPATATLSHPPSPAAAPSAAGVGRGSVRSSGSSSSSAGGGGGGGGGDDASPLPVPGQALSPSLSTSSHTSPVGITEFLRQCGGGECGGGE